jgi:transcriptional regulator with XRE-family HTH domain
LARLPRKPTVSNAQIGQQLRRVRLQAEMTQAALAKGLGTHQSHVSAIERGVRGLTLQQFLRIADALDVKPGEVLDEEVASSRRVRARHTTRRLRAIEDLPPDRRRSLLKLLDAFLAASR